MSGRQRDDTGQLTLRAKCERTVSAEAVTGNDECSCAAPLQPFNRGIDLTQTCQIGPVVDAPPGPAHFRPIHRIACRGKGIGEWRVLIRRALLAVQKYDAEPDIGARRARGDYQQSGGRQHCEETFH